MLENAVGIQGTVLAWFKSFLLNRTFSVNIGRDSSQPASLLSGVPQGSILGPILFSLYLLPLGLIFSKHGIPFHFYADDMQIYLPLKKNSKNQIELLRNCIYDIKSWLSLNFLKLNEEKTEVVWFGVPNNLDDLGDLAPFCKPLVRNLGVLFDSDLRFERQIYSVVKFLSFEINSESETISVHL